MRTPPRRPPRTASLPGIGRLHLRETLRNPFAWSAGVAVAAASLLARGVNDASLAALTWNAYATLLIPPLVASTVVPMLARPEAWALWSGLERRPGLAFVRAAVGVGTGTWLQVVAGAGVAGVVLGLDASRLALTLLAATAWLAVWTAASAFLVATIWDQARALATALAAWVLTTLAYGPALVEIVQRWGDRPLAAPLIAALLLHPAEAFRVGMLASWDVPVLVGPVAVLMDQFLPGPTMAWAAASAAAWTVALAAIAAWTFDHRDR